MNISDDEARAAVRTLLAYAGDDPEREGLLDTPARVVRAFGEWFGGYTEDPKNLLSRTFGEAQDYDEMIILRNVSFVSHCEHHLAPITGTATVGYVPSGRVVGISKLARVVDAYARRLQIQERLTQEIAQAVAGALEPRGVGVTIRASHGCMSSRGVRQHACDLVTSSLLGCFKQPEVRAEFFSLAAL